MSIQSKQVAYLTYSAVTELVNIYRESRNLTDVTSSDLYQKLESIGWDILLPDSESSDEHFYFTFYMQDYYYFSIFYPVDGGSALINYPGRQGDHRKNTGAYCHDLGKEFIKLGWRPLGLDGKWDTPPPKPLHLYNSTDVSASIVGFLIIFLFIAFFIFIFS